MPIPTEPIGSIPSSPQFLGAMSGFASGRISHAQFRVAEETDLQDAISRFEETGSPVITGGERTKPSFATYPLSGATNLAPDGVVIPFADCHTRQLPRLTAGPFRYGIHAVSYLRAARQFTERPLKQAVISASALTLLYPQQGIAQYSRETFLDDLTEEAQRDIRESSEQGADCVQIDFKLDPSGSLLSAFVELNNRGLEHFASGPRKDRRAQTWIMSTSYPFCFNSKSGVSTLNWPVNVTERRSSRKPERS